MLFLFLLTVERQSSRLPLWSLMIPKVHRPSWITIHVYTTGVQSQIREEICLLKETHLPLPQHLLLRLIRLSIWKIQSKFKLYLSQQLTWWKRPWKNLHSLFPDIDDDYLQSLLDKWCHIPPYQAINNVCNELLEKKDYPRKASTVTTPSATTTSFRTPQKEKDYLKDYSSFVSGKYSEQCYQLLQNEFRLISVKYIKIALSKFRKSLCTNKEVPARTASCI